jgi:hypothetical protein
MDLKARRRTSRLKIDPHNGMPAEVTAVAVPSPARTRPDEAMSDELRHSRIAGKGKRVPLQPRALRSMSRLEIRRCGHMAVQEKEPAWMTWDVSGRLPVRPAGRWTPCDSAALLLALFLGRSAAQRSDAPAPIDTGKVRRAADPSETTSSLYAVSPSSSGL